MNSNSPTVNDQAALQVLLKSVDALLLDFDGPICSVFAGFPAPTVAKQLREAIHRVKFSDLPEEIRNTPDPFAILLYCSKLGHPEATYIESALRAHELEAITSAEPTLAAHQLLHEWNATGKSIAIVSNNSTDAVQEYLDIHNLGNFVSSIHGRMDAVIEKLKPNPYLIERAAEKLDIPKQHLAMIGDSTSDVIAATRANIKCIAFANKPEKVAIFQEFNPNPNAVVTTMNAILDAVTSLQKHQQAD